MPSVAGGTRLAFTAVMRLTSAAVLTTAAAVALPSPAGADPAPRLQPLDSDAAPGLLTAPVPDRVLRWGATRRAAPRGALQPGAGRYYRTEDGHRLRVVVNGYRSSRAAVQTYVDFLGEKVLHGSELSRLVVVIQPPRLIAVSCRSRTAAACYTVPDQVMHIPGEEDRDLDLPLAFVITHEYGHHVAWNRSNAPFPAIHFGPKRWATAEGVCPKWVKGQLFPGEEKDFSRYLANPGEAWAEAFAVWHYRSTRWSVYTPLLRPDPRSLRAIREDVRRPWRRVRVRGLRLGLGPERPLASRTLSSPLDGIAAVRVRTTGSLRVSARVLHRGRVLAPTSRRSLRAIRICGARTLQLQLIRRSGRGDARVTFATP